MKVRSPMESRAEGTALHSSSEYSVRIERTGERHVNPVQSKPPCEMISSHSERQQSTQPSQYGHEARETYVYQGPVPSILHDSKADVPLDKLYATWQGTAFIVSTTTSAIDNAAKATVTSSEKATVPISAGSPLVVLRSQGATIMGKNAENTRDDGKRPEQRYEGPLNREQRGKVLRIFGSCSDCRRRRVACQPAHHNITWKDLDRWWSSHSNAQSSSEQEISAAGYLKHQNHAPFQEGTVADSGYVSACASRPYHGLEPHDELIDHGTIAQPEEHKRPAGDQHTVYTSLALPHGSDYITDLCNDIHLRLEHELLEHKQDQAWKELPKCLPDLIKALAIRIGLDRSNPASPSVMHFLHTHSK